MATAFPLIRVLQVVAAPTAGSHIGVNGPECRAANLLPHWQGCGVDVIIAYPRRGRLWSRFHESGIHLIDFEIGGKFRWERVAYLARLAREVRADIIHTQGPGSVDVFGVIAARLSGIRCVVSRVVMIDDMVNISLVRRAVYRRIERAAMRRVDRVIAVSEKGREHLLSREGVDPGRLDVVYNGVNLGRYRLGGRIGEAGEEGAAPRIGMVAQLTSPKGWRDFVDVIDKLAAKISGLKAQVVGDGPLRHEIEDSIRSRRLESVIEVLGHQGDVADVLRTFDIFLFTSHREGLSMAVLEAMACGLPIVATDVGAVREQVTDGQNGFVRPPGDVNSLVDACLTLVRSREMRTAFGCASRRYAEERFSESSMAKGYARSYRAAMGASEHGG